MTAELRGINREVAALRSANQQQEPKLARLEPLPPEQAIRKFAHFLERNYDELQREHFVNVAEDFIAAGGHRHVRSAL